VIAMLMPDVLEILNDPEVGGGVAFKVRRVTNTRKLGGVTRTVQLFDVTGNIQPQDKSVQASTTEDSLSESIVIRAPFEFSVGGSDGEVSFNGEDEILWDGRVWRVVRIDNWSKWGFSVAYATLVMDKVVETNGVV